MPELMDRQEELVERASGLFDVLRANAARADAERRLPDESVDAMIDAGVYQVWVPRRYGGYECDVRTQLDMTTELGRGCAAAGWVAAMMTAVSWMACWLPEQAQDEIYADPGARLVGIFTPGKVPVEPVDGGYLVSGAWPFATGCEWSTWAEVMAPVVDADGNMVNVLWCFVPMSDLEIKDTWYVMGMRGTASNTLVAEKLFVPEHRTVAMLGPDGVLGGTSRSEYRDEILYRIPLSMVGTICVVGSVVGAARAALEHVIETIPNRGISYSRYLNQAEAASTQMQVAEAATMIDTAALHGQRAAADAWAAGVEGVLPSETRRARTRHDCAFAIRECKHALDVLVSVSGASCFAEGALLERLYRDVSTATLHGVFRPDITSELYGSVLLGEQPTASPIL